MEVNALGSLDDKLQYLKKLIEISTIQYDKYFIEKLNIDASKRHIANMMKKEEINTKLKCDDTIALGELVQLLESYELISNKFSSAGQMDERCQTIKFKNDITFDISTESTDCHGDDIFIVNANYISCGDKYWSEVIRHRNYDSEFNHIVIKQIIDKLELKHVSTYQFIYFLAIVTNDHCLYFGEERQVLNFPGWVQF